MNSQNRRETTSISKFSILLITLLLFSGAAFSASQKKAPSPKTAPLPTSKSETPLEKAETKKELIKNIVTNCKQEVSLSQLVANPEEWVGKEVCFNGSFSSFSALALDYPAALRERKKYISITLFRPNTKIPLGELKLAMKIDEAQRHEVLPKVTEGDMLKIKGHFFSAAMGEPWADIEQIQVAKNPNNKDDNASNAFDEL